MIGIWSIIFQYQTEITYLSSFAAKNSSGCVSKDDAVKTEPGGRPGSVFVREVRQQHSTTSLQLDVTFTSPFSSHYR